ncbi:carbohydrate ABC transporter permease [Muricoccus radiodurans]|uniref:carbohydrate ABC transporter permease n=1 Tax=Muricoccus radiodurans TaxID=2231721 RepID=UPI003CF53533
MAEAATPAAFGGARTPLARGLVYALLIGFAAFYLAPLLVVVLNSLRSAGDIGATSVIGLPQAVVTDNFARAWGSYCIAQTCAGIAPYMANSFLMVIPATILSTLLGALNGYSIALWRFRGDQWVFGLITLGVFLPEQMKLIPWTLVLRDLGLTGSLWGLVLIHVVQGISFTTLFCRNYYVAIPQELLKAARIDGAGFFRIFWRIVLPLSPPILIVTVIWQFTHIWNEFLYGVTFTSGLDQPVTAALIALSVSVSEAPQYGVQSAAVLLAALPTLLVYLFGGRYFLRGLTAGAVK